MLLHQSISSYERSVTFHRESADPTRVRLAFRDRSTSIHCEQLTPASLDPDWLRYRTDKPEIDHSVGKGGVTLCI